MKENTTNMDAILQEKKREHQLDEAFELSNAASFTDCTGMVVSAPLTEEQWENYEETTHFDPIVTKLQQDRRKG